MRVVIEMRTGGRIKAEMWPTPGSRWKKENSGKISKKKINQVALSDSQKRTLDNFMSTAESKLERQIVRLAIRTARTISAGEVDRMLRRYGHQQAALRKDLAKLEAMKLVASAKAKTPPTPPAAAI